MSSSQILIVEDELIVADDLATDLQGLGYVVTGIASTGEEAIRCVAITNPDLVLMDIRLAGKMDGVQTAHAIQRMKETPIVYLTAYADNETLERAKTNPTLWLPDQAVHRQQCPVRD